MTAEDLRPIWYLDHPLWQYTQDVNAIAEANGWRIVESKYDGGGGVTGPALTVDPAYTASLANPAPMIGVGDIPGGAGLGDVTSAQLAASQATQNTKITALESGKAAGLLTGTTDPIDDATTAWKVGQIYENTATGARFRSTAASTAPPAPAGSAWEPAAGNATATPLTAAEIAATAGANLTKTGAVSPDLLDTYAASRRDQFKGLLNGTGAPVDGTTTAWFAGQLYEDTVTGKKYKADTASTAPLTAPAGSTWTETTTATSAVQTLLIEERTAADIAVQPPTTAGLRTYIANQDDGSRITWRRADDVTPWAVTHTSKSGDGNADYLPPIKSRIVSTRGVLPTAAEVNNAELKAGDAVLVELPDGTKEFYEHGATNWALVDTDEPIVTAIPLTPAQIVATTGADSTATGTTSAALLDLYTTARRDKLRGLLNGTTAPVNDTTTAWFVGQMYEDTVTGKKYRADTASTDPTVAATGSVWTETATTSTPAVIDIQERPDADKATAPTAANGIRYVISTHEDDTTIIWSRADDATPFAVTNTNVSGDGNPDMLPTITSRTVSTRGVLPTAAETNNATLKDGDMVLVKLPDGTKEIFEHDGTVWALLDTIESDDDTTPHVPLIVAPAAMPAITPSERGQVIEIQLQPTYELTRTDAVTGVKPTFGAAGLEIESTPVANSVARVLLTDGSYEYWTWDGADLQPGTVADYPAPYNFAAPALTGLKAGDHFFVYANVGADESSAPNNDKYIQVNGLVKLNGSQQANEYARINQRYGWLRLTVNAAEDGWYATGPGLNFSSSSSASTSNTTEIGIGNNLPVNANDFWFFRYTGTVLPLGLYSWTTTDPNNGTWRQLG